MQRNHEAEAILADQAIIHEQPIKTAGGELVEPDRLRDQAEQALACRVPVDYHKVRGTCIDERFREGSEPRPSVPGGPDIYALAVLELTGSFTDDEGSATKRLKAAQGIINRAGFPSGGHYLCAANGSFLGWNKIIAASPDLVRRYAHAQMGDRYRPELADQVVKNAIALVENGRYDEWQENCLTDVYGDEADEAMERLGDVPHGGWTFVRNKLAGTTVDQTPLYNRSVLGEGSFVMDDPYADDIEHALASGPDAVIKKQLAEHAREIILAAVAGAVPNQELYQIDLN